MNRRALLLVPFAGAALTTAGFWAVLSRMRQGTFDPHTVPNPLIGGEVPAFDLPAVPGFQGFGRADLVAQGRPVLVNFFASWCVPCLVEHPTLLALSREGVPVWGIAYKDKPEAAAAFIARHGNPYARIAQDLPGRVAIDWGVYGVPETYLVDPKGVVRWRQAGPVTAEVAEGELRPLLRSLA